MKIILSNGAIKTQRVSASTYGLGIKEICLDADDIKALIVLQVDLHDALSVLLTRFQLKDRFSDIKCQP